MQCFENVRSMKIPEAKVIDNHFVYVNTDIREITVTYGERTYTEYEFNQTRYSKDEYIKLLDEKNSELEAQLTDTQLALCEVYELML